MTREEYERRRQRLDGELRAGIEALETAHRLQVRALELTWMMISQETVAPAPPPAELEDGDHPLSYLEVIARCPDVFDRNDFCRVLGFEPERSTLYRSLQELVQDGTLTVQQRGEGRTPTRYAKRGSTS
jgi:hypothetical protein